MKDDERRRNNALFRQFSIKQHEEDNANKLIHKQKQSQQLHEIGIKKTAHTHSIPVNPINLAYENNERGRLQANIDEENKINKLVRSHHLQTCGNSGYNIINGKPSLQVDYSLHSKEHQAFEEKLNRYYSQFKIDAS